MDDQPFGLDYQIASTHSAIKAMKGYTEAHAWMIQVQLLKEIRDLLLKKD